MLAYVKWLWEIESPIVILSAFGSLVAFAKARHRFAVFTAFWAFGLFLAYTIIPYKTPWLAVSFLLPMCIIAGYGVGEFLRVSDINQRVIGGVLALAAIIVLGYQTYQLNFVRYDDEAMPYIYAHTKRGFLDLIGQIHYYAEKSEKGNKATVEVVSPDYWSMPWYLKDYKNAHFFGQITDVNSAEMIVAKKTDQDAQIREKYAARYKIAGEFPLRPGVDLYLLVRNDLAEADARKIGANDDDSVPSEMPENGQ
jgi:predicted membrane-bound mannosyltransferase